MWVSFKVHYGKTHSPVDHDPTTYSDVRFFTDELAAYRYANSVSAMVVQVEGNGDDLDHVRRNTK